MNVIRDMCADPEAVRLPDTLKSGILRIIRLGLFTDLLARVVMTQVFRIRGHNKNSDSYLVTLFFGDEKTAHLFSQLVYSEDATIEALAKTPYGHVRSMIENSNVDIVLVYANAMFSCFFSKRGFFTLPILRQAMDISGSWDEFVSRLSRGRRRDISAIERLGYACEASTDPERFSFFYRKMYLPYTLKRRGESAKPSTLYELKKCFLNGGILFVRQSGELVSGILYSKYGNVVQNICSGAPEGVNEESAKIAVQAARYHLIRWSMQQGYREIDHGLSDPFMKDGVFAYKREWGMAVRSNQDMIRSTFYALKLCRFGESVKEFLARNPFIFSENGDLRGLAFIDSEDPTEGELTKLFRLYYTPGLSDLVVISRPKKTGSSNSAFQIDHDGHSLKKASSGETHHDSFGFLEKLGSNTSFNVQIIDTRNPPRTHGSQGSSES